MTKLSAREVLLARLRSQRLHRDHAEADVAGVVADIGGVQAQDMAAARLQIRARTEGLTAADVDRVRAEERTIVRTSAMRGTLHIVPTDDINWLLTLLGPELIRKNRRRF